MTDDLSTLVNDRNQLARRIDDLEAALARLEQDAKEVDTMIASAQRRRKEITDRGRRMFALLQEIRRDLERYDLMINQTVETLASEHIGNREGAYVLNGFVIARLNVGGTLFTSLVEAVSG